MKNLRKAVEALIKKSYGDIDDHNDYKVFLNDIAAGGCVDGLVGDLIYTVDIVDFYNEYEKEINEFLFYKLDEYGYCCLCDLLGRFYDNTDPLCIEDSNITYTVWAVVELIAQELLTELDINN